MNMREIQSLGREEMVGLIAQLLALNFQKIVNDGYEFTRLETGDKPKIEVACVVLVRSENFTRAAVNAEKAWSDNDITDALNQVIGGIRAGNFKS